MHTPSVLIVYGTRPEAIKLAPVVSLLQDSEDIALTVVSTGQHREMLDQVEEKFNLRPDFQLDLMEKNQPLNRIISRAMKRLDAILDEVKPKVVVVQGDTTTAMSAAIAGFNRQAKVVHVEAGLRSGDLRAPFPEEANRKIITQVSSLHLAPTQFAKENLLHDGVAADDIFITGNTVIDALHTARNWDIEFSSKKLSKAVESGKRIVLITTHRRENFKSLAAIGRAISLLSILHPNDLFVVPIHPNPIVKKAIKDELKGLSNVVLTKPLPYGEFTKLLAHSYMLLTDSGGLQEEAPSLGKPVLVMRKNTERPEGVLAGTVKLVGAIEYEIVREVTTLLENDEVYETMASAANPYGDGLAAARTVAAIKHLLDIGTPMPEFDPLLKDSAK